MCKQPSRQFQKVFLAAGRPEFSLLAERRSDVGESSPCSEAQGTSACPECAAQVQTAVRSTAEGGRSPQLSPLGLFSAPAEPSQSVPSTRSLSGALRPKNKASRSTTAETEENLQSSLL